MAKYILWFAFILTLIFCTNQVKNDQPLELFTQILFWSILGVLAICESIEKTSKH